MRFFVSGPYTDNQGALKQLHGRPAAPRAREPRLRRPQQPPALGQHRVRQGNDRQRATDFGLFGTLLRGAPAGTNYLARDTLGRADPPGRRLGLRGHGQRRRRRSSIHSSASTDSSIAGRYIGSLTATYFPADWVTFDGTFAYDKRSRYDNFDEAKGFRTITTSASARTSAT